MKIINKQSYHNYYFALIILYTNELKYY